jgi:hypothetical protein
VEEGESVAEGQALRLRESVLLPQLLSVGEALRHRVHKMAKMPREVMSIVVKMQCEIFPGHGLP